jgi:hypothetical protein
MPEPVKISTSKYTKQGKVEVDGKVWSIVLPGAGTELKLSQAFRGSKLWGSRINLLDEKINTGDITETELDKYEEYIEKFESCERIIFDYFSTMFKDETEDNSEVKEWISGTPSIVMEMAFKDIKEQANETSSESS